MEIEEIGMAMEITVEMGTDMDLKIITMVMEMEMAEDEAVNADLTRTYILMSENPVSTGFFYAESVEILLISAGWKFVFPVLKL